MAIAEKSRRTESREKRREQLIDATMKVIARKGISGMTLGDVAGEAGLSQGIVNLHFDSKDNLLTETLKTLADEYQRHFERCIERAGPGPAEKLLACIEMDVRPSIADRGKLAVWFGFWGEVKHRPTYRKICGELDEYYDAVVADLCAQIIEEGAYENLSPKLLSTAIAAMTNGYWLSCLVSPGSWDRHEAIGASKTFLAGVFPSHFSLRDIA